MAYNNDKKGYETKDGGLIRINGEDKVRIDIYEGNELEKGGHTCDTINYDTNTDSGSIDQHNADKSEKSSTDVSCFLTTACMRHFRKNFIDFIDSEINLEFGNIINNQIKMNLIIDDSLIKLEYNGFLDIK